MSTINRVIKYRCDNDCKMSGCEGHKLVGSLQTTSDVVIINNENGEYVYSGDINRTNALLDILHSLDYEHSIYFKTLKGLNNRDDFEDNLLESK